MSENEAKAFSTFVLWVVLGIIGFKAMNTEFGDMGAVIAVVVGILGMAAIGMSAIWVLPAILQYRSAEKNAPESAGKVKRGSRREEQLALLMELMGDEELLAFKDLLKQRILDDAGYGDGELPYGSKTLAALLDERADRHLRR